MNRAMSTSTGPTRRIARRGFLRLACGGLLGLAPVPLLVACDAELPHVVEISDNGGYSPGALSIPKGGTVRWKNLGVFAHTVTDDPAQAQNKSDTSLPAGAPPFDSGPLYAGQTWTRKFDVPGQYVYYSSLDQGRNLIGTITVTA